MTPEKRILRLKDWLLLDRAELKDAITSCFDCEERYLSQYQARIAKLTGRIARNEAELERLEEKPQLTMEPEDDMDSYVSGHPMDPNPAP